MRFDDPTMTELPAFLALAEECGRLAAVVRQSAALSPLLAKPEVLLFVNLHASDLADPTLTPPDAPLSKLASRASSRFRSARVSSPFRTFAWWRASLPRRENSG